MLQFTDHFERKFYYLRLSVTDVCNFRCVYCLPEGYHPGNHANKDFLTLDEIRRITHAFAVSGTEKVRLTGGEPSLRRDFSDIIATVAQLPAINQITVTTNGYRLARDIALWRQAGLTGINVSIDSLNPHQFRAITGQNKLHQIFQGIDAAFAAGFTKVKVNTVLMQHINHQSLKPFLEWIRTRPIQLRFIELMETGDNRALFQRHHISGAAIRDRLVAYGWSRQTRGRSDGPAQVFAHPDYLGEVGLIMPYEKDFCAICNRPRVSALGNLHLCLFGDGGIPLRDLLADDDQHEALVQRIRPALANKKRTHFLHHNQVGITENLAYIGG